MKFEPTHINGQYYKTRNGDKVKIYDISEEHGKYKIHGAMYKWKQWSILSWLENGDYDVKSFEGTDIVDYWEEDKFKDNPAVQHNKWCLKQENLAEFKGLSHQLKAGSAVYLTDLNEVKECKAGESQSSEIKLAIDSLDALAYINNELFKKYDNKIQIGTPCQHEWESVFLLSSAKENCKKCGMRSEDV